MSELLPLFYWILLGLLGGIAVNYISDWFSVRRELVSQEFQDGFSTKAYWLGLTLNPWRFSGSSTGWKLRVYIAHGVMVAGSVLLGYFGLLSEVAFWWGYPLLVYLMIVVIMDMEHRVILHPISLFGAAFGLALGSYLHGIVATILGGVFGFGMMYLMYRMGGWWLRRMKRWRGEEEEEEPVPLGFGDVNLSGVMGLLLGWPGVWVGFLVTVLAGGIIGGLYLLVMVLLRKYRADLAMPYGPFIVFAILTLLYFRSSY